MTVKELIAALREADPSGELDVVIHTDCAVTDVVLSVPLDYVRESTQRKPRIRLAVDCYCGYS